MGRVSIVGKSDRKRPVSCHFCRSRKLRCSRQPPCTNCVSRGISCSLYPANSTTNNNNNNAVGVPINRVAVQSVQHPANQANGEVMARLLRLEEIVLKHADPASTRTAPMHRPFQTSSLTTFAPTEGGISSRIEAEVLGKVAINHDWFTSISPIDICFRVCSVKHIPQSPTYLWPGAGRSTSFQEPVRCVWLPLREEARKLWDKYVRDVTFIHHVIHTPTVRALIDNVYDKLAQDQTVPPGQVALLTSIFGSSSYAWTINDADPSMFVKSEEAHCQSTMWVRSCLDLLDHCRRCSIRSFEALQASIITFFMLVNLEGITMRYASMLGQAISMAREIGLHRLDHPNFATREQAPKSGTIVEEIGRRIWWYLCATDWMLSRYAGPQEGCYSIQPRHIATRKPWNVDDEELYDGMPNVDKPLSQPTEMSYFLQRIRLGEMCRELIDRMPLGTTPGGDNSAHADVMAVDAQFARFLDEIPEFFKLDSAENGTNSIATPDGRQQSLTKGIVVQRYILHSLLHSHRCKIHLPYIAKAHTNPRYGYCREACLEAARQTIRTERLLERENVNFLQTRFRIAGVLQAVFIAAIAFLLDMCFSNNAQRQCDPKRKAELLDACSILEEARTQCPVTTSLLESLDNVVQKYKLPLPRLTTLHATGTRAETQVFANAVGAQTTSALEENRVLNSRNVDAAPQKTELDMPSSFDWHAFNEMEVDGVDWNALLSELDMQFLAGGLSSV